MRRHVRLSFVSVVLAVVALTLSAGATSNIPAPTIQSGSEVEVEVLALNDFHGNLLPPSGSSGRVGSVNAGGAEYLATHVRTLVLTCTLEISNGDDRPDAGRRAAVSRPCVYLQKRLRGVRPSQAKPAAEALLIVVVKQPPRRAGTRKAVRPAAPVAARPEK